MPIKQEVEAVRTAAPATVSPKEALAQMLERQKGAIAASLPSTMSAERFTRLLLTAVNSNPQLLDCTPRSFLAAGVFAAQLGLEPNNPRGLAYLIPFRDNRTQTTVCTFIVGYRGMMELARRSGLVTSINAYPVFEGDNFSYRLGLDPTLDHYPNDDNEGNPAKLTHVYAVAKVGGDPQFVILTRRQIDKVKAGSPGARSDRSPWQTHYVEMALKTAIRRLCKYLPQTVEAAMAIAHDEQERPLSLGDLGMITPIEHDAEDVTETTAAEQPADQFEGYVPPEEER